MTGKVLNPELQESSVTQGLDVASIWKFSTKQYQQMIANGTIAEDDPVELLEGWLVTKMSKKSPHRITTRLTRGELELHIPDAYYVDTQEAITAIDSVPEPDVMVIQGQPRDYPDGPPDAKFVRLVIEVSESSLRRDRTVKQRIYAAAGIPVYWILNLQDRVLEVYTNPLANEKRYAEMTIYTLDDVVPFMLEGKEMTQIAVKNLLP
jgi:Uma2 family endonuclease